MGFTEAQAKKALRETVRIVAYTQAFANILTSFKQSGNLERAVEWLFSHPDDDGYDNDTTPTTATASLPAVVPGRQDVPARYKLLGFVSHKGPSVHSGHYVAHVKKGDQWVLFNDEKVVKADAESVKELKKLAYLYFLVRA